jgi:hypothetical protein
MISLEKKYKTRGGKTPKIYSVGNGLRYPIHGALDDMIECWTSDGNYNIDCIGSQFDLIEVNPYQEILAEAKRRYKVGDLIKCFVDNEVYKLHSFDYPSTTELTLEGKELWLLDPTCTGIKVYANGEWAEIVQPEEPKQYTAENINTLNFEQLSEVAKMCMDRMLELSKKIITV